MRKIRSLTVVWIWTTATVNSTCILITATASQNVRIMGRSIAKAIIQHNFLICWTTRIHTCLKWVLTCTLMIRIRFRYSLLKTALKALPAETSTLFMPMIWAAIWCRILAQIWIITRSSTTLTTSLILKKKGTTSSLKPITIRLTQTKTPSLTLPAQHHLQTMKIL